MITSFFASLLPPVMAGSILLIGVMLLTGAVKRLLIVDVVTPTHYYDVAFATFTLAVGGIFFYIMLGYLS